MRPLRVLLPVLGLLLAAGPLPGEDEIPKGLEKMQGSWRLTGLVVEGRPIVPPPSNTTLVVKGDSFTFTAGKAIRGKYRADPTAKPATLDVTYIEGDRKDTTLLAVYEVKGNTLTLCVASNRKTRPEQVAARVGTIVETWTRIK